MFTSEDLDAFWWPTDAELTAWNKFWFETPLPHRHSPQMATPPWDFMSMIDSILGAEYWLAGLSGSEDGVLALNFEPEAWPYGGTGALRALVRALGHTIVGFTGDDGYVSGDPLPPRWPLTL